jgi:hypothetical protein
VFLVPRGRSDLVIATSGAAPAEVEFATGISNLTSVSNIANEVTRIAY